MINGVIMKTITLIATGMAVHVVTTMLQDGTHIAQVHVSPKRTLTFMAMTLNL
jgi:folate-dependent phosphoribosylglycinamide formyltransferase PurN